jgi:hypothetical protein
VRAYVTFKDDTGRDAALAAQPRNAWHRWKCPVELKLRGTHVLRMDVAPEVTDIKFENLEFTGMDRFMARLATGTFKAGCSMY